MTNVQMRERLANYYNKNNKTWQTKVSKMSDAQVVAVFFSLINKGKGAKKVDKKEKVADGINRITCLWCKYGTQDRIYVHCHKQESPLFNKLIETPMVTTCEYWRYAF